MKIFGERLRELRIERGFSQQKLADVFNVKQSTVADWERNIMETDFETLAKIALYFEVTSDYLLGLAD